MVEVERKGFGKAEVVMIVATLAVILIASNILVYVNLQNQINAIVNQTSDLQSEVESLQTQLYARMHNVNIVHFEMVESFWEGMTVRYTFTIEINNFGNNSMSGMILMVRVLGNSSELDNDSKYLDTLEAGHSETINMTVRVADFKVGGKKISYVATLYSDTSVVDEVTLS